MRFIFLSSLNEKLETGFTFSSGDSEFRFWAIPHIHMQSSPCVLRSYKLWGTQADVWHQTQRKWDRACHTEARAPSHLAVLVKAWVIRQWRNTSVLGYFAQCTWQLPLPRAFRLKMLPTATESHIYSWKTFGRLRVRESSHGMCACTAWIYTEFSHLGEMWRNRTVESLLRLWFMIYANKFWQCWNHLELNSKCKIAVIVFDKRWPSTALS